jgi:4-hydroxy-tetrahydrodipicolinate reductase
MEKIRVVVSGAAGRMGQRVIALAAEEPDLAIVGALEAPNHPKLGQDAGVVAGREPLGVPLSAEFQGKADVLIDFSHVSGFDSVVRTCRNNRLALVFATTGITPEQERALVELAEFVPVIRSPNMSLAVNVAMKLCQMAAEALKDKDADVEIIERHHRFKEDAPSGTALQFGNLISQIMGQIVHRHGRQGRPGRRPHEEIGYHAVRVGDNPGEHTIIFGLLGETLEITVRATNRDAYAKGALAAARFVVKQPPGLYGMRDVLGL